MTMTLFTRLRKKPLFSTVTLQRTLCSAPSFGDTNSGQMSGRPMTVFVSQKNKTYIKNDQLDLLILITLFILMYNRFIIADKIHFPYYFKSFNLCLLARLLPEPRKPTIGCKILILFKVLIRVFGERGPGKRQVSPDYRQMSTEF
jgi:hypothetical protein